MSSSLQAFITLLLAGLLLFGFEVFLPGGILGALGAAALFGAIIAGFYAFDPPWSYISGFAVMLLSVVNIVLWLIIVPRTRVGKSLTLEDSAASFKSSTEHMELLGRRGTAITDLRPSGLVSIDGTRVDVVADASWLQKGTQVEVISIHGNRIEVSEVDGPSA